MLSTIPLTHFTETSQSLIDIFMVTNPDDVVDCGVGEPFLDQLVRYHCPIYYIPVATTFKRKAWRFSNGDYPKLRGINSAFDWNSCFHIEIDIYAANFTKTLMSFCDTCIPSKVVTIRKQDPPWFYNEIRSKTASIQLSKTFQLYQD